MSHVHYSFPFAGEVYPVLCLTAYPVGEINGTPEYQGDIIFSVKHGRGTWRALTAGTSPFVGENGNDYDGAPEQVVATSEHKLFPKVGSVEPDRAVPNELGWLPWTSRTRSLS